MEGSVSAGKSAVAGNRRIAKKIHKAFAIRMEFFP